jgi:hypothetical protein
MVVAYISPVLNIHSIMMQRRYGVDPSSLLSPRSVIEDDNDVFTIQSPLRKYLASRSFKRDAKARASIEKTPMKSKRKDSRIRHEDDMFSMDSSVHIKKQDRKNSKTKKDAYSRCSTDVVVNKGDDGRTSSRNSNGTQRRVRFHMNKNGSVLCTEYKEPVKMEFDDDEEYEKDDLWWTKSERKSTRTEAKLIIQLIRIQRPEYREASLQLLSKFGGMNLPLDFQLSDHDAVIVSATSGARGLEKWVYPFLGIPNPDYYTSVKRLVATQQRLIQEGCFDANLREATLAKEYAGDSFPASAIARLLADGDFLVARTNEIVQI